MLALILHHRALLAAHAREAAAAEGGGAPAGGPGFVPSSRGYALAVLGLHCAAPLALALCACLVGLFSQNATGLAYAALLLVATTPPHAPPLRSAAASLARRSLARLFAGGRARGADCLGFPAAEGASRGAGPSGLWPWAWLPIGAFATCALFAQYAWQLSIFKSWDGPTARWVGLATHGGSAAEVWRAIGGHLLVAAAALAQRQLQLSAASVVRHGASAAAAAERLRAAMEAAEAAGEPADEIGRAHV